MPDELPDLQETELIDPHPQPRRRLLVWVIGIFIASLVLGALLAPHVFNGLLWLGRNIKALRPLKDVEFEKVASRCVLAVAMLSLIPAVFLARVAHFRNLGWVRTPAWRREIGLGLLIGCASMTAAFLLGWAADAYAPSSELAPGVAGKVAAYLFGALLVGVIEETVFRGALFGSLRRLVGFWGAAAVSSAIYSAIHFARPVPRIGVVYGHWYSGLRLLPQMFNTVRWGYYSFPIALTLFVMGLVLCAYYRRHRNLYLVIGLHAGWVWIMRIGQYFFDRKQGVMTWAFGPGELVSQSYLALFVMLAFLAAALRPARRAGR